MNNKLFSLLDKCVSCEMTSVNNELLLCIQLSLSESENLQQVIDEAFKTKTVQCPKCSGKFCNVQKEITEAPMVLLLHVSR